MSDLGTQEPTEQPSIKWPSVDDSKPAEEGGPAARIGFNYQDEIAVGFLIEMLETRTVIKIHCETHDDILVVRAPAGTSERIAEYVQVKASKPDKLWSLADLCLRKEGKSGTSIFEVSLARDKHQEHSQFRIVTLRPVVSELAVLTFPFGKPGREADGVRFKTLQSGIETRCPGFASAKGNAAAFWLNNCRWDQRHSKEVVCNDNLLRLIRLSSREKRTLLPEQAEQLLSELRRMAKDAGDAKWEPDRDKKIIARSVLRAWWENRTQQIRQGAASVSGGKLAEKMKDAKLPDDVIELALDLRRGYAAAYRSPRYLENNEGARLQTRVKSEVMSLRARLVSGQLDVDGAGFHSLCLDRLDAISTEEKADNERSAFMKGCMYDIADRCMLRFVGPA